MDETSSPASQPDAITKKLKWPRQPYPGLRPFEVDDQVDESLVFFGRDKQKDEILRRLNDSHVVFVVGPSGSGKSSLVKAGVIPALRAGLLTSAGHHWRIAQTRPERRPLAQLAEALAKQLAEPDEADSICDRRDAIEDLLRQEDSALWLVADSISKRHAAAGHPRLRTLLLIDQFEEAFAPEIQDRDEVDQYFRILTRFFAKPHRDLYLIIAMRTGYVGSTAAHPDVAEMLNSTAYLTPILTPSQMATAITRPAETYGGGVEPELVQAILSDAAKPTEDMADQLPLVQHALFWMWERTWRNAGLKAPPRPGDDPPSVVPPLSLAQYREHDGLKGIMQRHAEERYATAIEGGNSARQLCEQVFKRLCERDIERRYRRTPPTIKELQELTGASAEELRAVIAPFIASSAALLSVRPQAGSTEEVIDINHESLIRQWDRLRRWADEEAREVATFRELVGSARQWNEDNRDERHLRTGGQLELVESFWRRTNPRIAWAKRYRTINRNRSLAEDLPLVKDYVAASRNQKKRKKLYDKAVSFGFFAAVASIGALMSLLYLERDRVSNTVAQVGALVASDKPIDALLLAEHAIQEELPMSSQLEEFIRSVVSEFRLETEIKGGDFASIAFSPAEGANDLLIGDRQGGLHTWKDGDPKPSAVQISADASQDDSESNNTQKWFRWSPDGEFVFLSNAYSRGASEVYDVIPASENSSGLTSLEKVFAIDGDDARRAQFSGDGDLLVTFGRGPVKLWDLKEQTGQANEAIKLPAGSWNSDAEFSPDGRHLALESRGRMMLFDVDKLRADAAPDPLATNSIGDARSLMVFHPSDPGILVTADDSGIGKLWELDQENGIRELRNFVEMDDGIRTIAISPDGNWIATSAQDGDIWLSPGTVEVDQEETENIRLAGITEIEALSFSSDSGKLASVSKDGVVRIWSVEPRWEGSTADFERNNWTAALKDLKPTQIDTRAEGATEWKLNLTLNCLVSPDAPECSSEKQ